MSTGQSPLDRIFDWFDSLSRIQRHDVAAILGPRFPGINLDPAAGDIEAQFVSQLRALITSPLKEWGVIICFRDLLEQFVIQKRGSAEQWKEARAILENLAAARGDESYARQAQKTEFFGAQWVKSCKRWEDSVRPYLSDRYLKAFYDEPLVTLSPKKPDS